MLRGEVRPGRREAAGDRGASSVRGRARLQIGGRPRGGAHVEHLVHACDAGGIEAQRLVEGVRPLPSRKKGIRGCGVRYGLGGGRACSGGGASGVHGEVLNLSWGVKAARSARGTCGSWF